MSRPPLPDRTRSELGLARCILCERPRAILGLFEPVDPWRYYPHPPAPGKVRPIAYALCRRCFDRPDRCEAVEAEILRRAESER